MYLASVAHKLHASFIRFKTDISGAVTASNVIWMVIFIGLGGLAVDSAQAFRIRAMLRAGADAGAHGAAAAMAMNTRNIHEPENHMDPTEVALDIVARTLPGSKMEDILRREEVEFGTWVSATHKFIPNHPDMDAVRVTLRRQENRLNPVPTFLLKILGRENWDVSASAVARIVDIQRGRCHNPILTARTRVDIENINAYVGICVRAHVTAEVAEDGAWVPDLVADTVDALMQEQLLAAGGGDLLGGITGSLGLGGALGGLTGGATASASSLLLDAVADADTTVTLHNLDFAQVVANESLHVTCNSNEVLTIPGGISLPGVTIFSDCPVRLDQEAELETTIIISNLWSLLNLQVSGNLPNGIALNSRNECGPGDGVRILIFVDVAAAARLQLFNIAPFSDVLAAAELGTSAETTAGILGAGLSITGELLTDVLLEDLAGLCLGAEFMLETSAVAFAK